jgi:transposase
MKIAKRGALMISIGSSEGNLVKMRDNVMRRERATKLIQRMRRGGRRKKNSGIRSRRLRHRVAQ